MHGQRYLPGQRLQAEHWLGARPGDLVWCTAASGWSKSARNVFIAPWLRGAAALLHDARFDPARAPRAARARAASTCSAWRPTEYRVIAKRADARRRCRRLRGLVAAGEALNPEVLRAWHEATGLEIRDGYGQTETGQLTGVAAGGAVRPGLDGPRAARHRRCRSTTASWSSTRPPSRRSSSATSASTSARRTARSRWHTGDRVRRRTRTASCTSRAATDDVIISAGYRIGPFEVESALVAHPAVAEAAAVAAPDEERGSVVRAVVVLRDGAYAPSPELARELQEHVKRETAPYKYPRIVEFADELPKTASGKVKRAELRARD